MRFPHNLPVPLTHTHGTHTHTLVRTYIIFSTSALSLHVFQTTRRDSYVKVKILPQQAEVAQRVPGRLRPRIFLTFGTTSVVGRQPYAPAAFTPGEIRGTHF